MIYVNIMLFFRKRSINSGICWGYDLQPR